MAEHRAGDHLDAEGLHGPLQPPPERDLVVEDGGRVPAREVQVTGRLERGENVVEHPVRQLHVLRRVPEHPQNRPISECTICPPINGSESMSTTERPRRADSMAAVEPRDPGADDAHVGRDLVHGPGGRPRHRVQPKFSKFMRHVWDDSSLPVRT